MLKHFEILSRVLYLYCNVVVHNQAETKRDDWTDAKQTFHRTTILHTVQQNKQVFIVAADAVLTQRLTIMPPPDFSEDFGSILIHTQLSRF